MAGFIPKRRQNAWSQKRHPVAADRRLRQPRTATPLHRESRARARWRRRGQRTWKRRSQRGWLRGTRTGGRRRGLAQHQHAPAPGDKPAAAEGSAPGAVAGERAAAGRAAGGAAEACRRPDSDDGAESLLGELGRRRESGAGSSSAKPAGCRLTAAPANGRAPVGAIRSTPCRATARVPPRNVGVGSRGARAQAAALESRVAVARIGDKGLTLGDRATQ